MGEVADLAARPGHDLAVDIEHLVQFLRKRRHLDREFPFDMLALTGPNLAERLGKPPQRHEAIAHLHQRRNTKRQRQNAENHGEGDIKTPGFLLDFLGIAADRNDEAILLAKVDFLLDNPQALAFRPEAIAIAEIPRAEGRPGSTSAGRRLENSDREVRRMLLAPLSRSRRTICQYQPESGIWNCGSPRLPGSTLPPSVKVATSATRTLR